MPTNDEIAESLWGGELAPRQQNPNEATARAALSLLAPHIANPDFWKEPAPPSMEPNAAGKVPEVKDPRVAGVLSDVAQTASNMFPFGGPAEGATALATKAIFAGPMARTANKDMLAKAMSMTNNTIGGTRGQLQRMPSEIWDKTGWFRGADGKWRFEIPDDNLHVSLPSADQRSFTDNGLGTILRHPELKTAYPELMENLHIKMKRGPISGEHNPNLHSIEVHSPTVQDARETAAHELQHVVQDFEGFAPGTSPATIRDMILPEMQKRGIDVNDKAIQEQLRNIFHKTYENFAGESEARNVAERVRFSQRDRKELPPFYTQDAPFHTQIIPSSYVKQQNPEIQEYIRTLMSGKR